MNHRKKDHQNTVKLCNSYQLGICIFNDESCWFKHEISDDDKIRGHDDGMDIPEKDDNHRQEQVFQKVSENLEPPNRKKH